MSEAIKVKEIQRKLWENRGIRMSTEELTALLETKEGGVKQMKKTARIFAASVGGYNICDNELDYLDARGINYPTKIAAQRAAKEMGYTHAIGSGTYRKDTTKL